MQRPFRKAANVGARPKYHIVDSSIESAHCGVYMPLDDYLRYLEPDEVPKALRCRRNGCRQAWELWDEEK